MTKKIARPSAGRRSPSAHTPGSDRPGGRPVAAHNCQPCQGSHSGSRQFAETRKQLRPGQKEIIVRYIEALGGRLDLVTGTAAA